MDALRLFDEVVDHVLAVCRYRQPLDARIFVIVASNDEVFVEQSPYGSLHLPFVKAALFHGLSVAGSALGFARDVQQQCRAVAGHVRPIDSAQKLRQIPTRIGGVWWATPTHSLVSVLCAGRCGKYTRNQMAPDRQGQLQAESGRIRRNNQGARCSDSQC